MNLREKQERSRHFAEWAERHVAIPTDAWVWGLSGGIDVHITFYGGKPTVENVRQMQEYLALTEKAFSQEEPI